LVRLVEDLFELVQLDAGAGHAQGGCVPLAAVVSGALGACRVTTEEAGVRVSAHVDGVADASVSPRLERVVQNLLQNAIRHTPRNGSVRVHGVRVDGWLDISVSDTGEGMPPEVLAFVFEPFWRGDPARSGSGSGSGLGLALVKRIVEALGGNVGVESAPGRGSRFTVRVPATTDSVTDL
jgi:signal transduction histidine kinase